MKICLDTNVLISGIFWKGIPGQILEAWIDGRFDLLISIPILDEYERILQRVDDRLHSFVKERWIQLIVERSTMISISHSLQWSRDIKDDKFLDCAVAGMVDYLVTGDKDLLVLKEQVPVEIVTPAIFLKNI